MSSAREKGFDGEEGKWKVEYDKKSRISKVLLNTIYQRYYLGDDL